jgi:hypothetical protein
MKLDLTTTSTWPGPGVVAIGVAQEFQSVFATSRRDYASGPPSFTFYKADRRVTAYYFYVMDAEFGHGFIKLCAYIPLPRQGLGQRSRVGLVSGDQSGPLVQQARQRLRFVQRSRETPTALRYARSPTDPVLLRALAARYSDAAAPRGPCGRVLVGTLHAPNRGLGHDRL